MHSSPCSHRLLHDADALGYPGVQRRRAPARHPSSPRTRVCRGPCSRVCCRPCTRVCRRRRAAPPVRARRGLGSPRPGACGLRGGWAGCSTGRPPRGGDRGDGGGRAACGSAASLACTHTTSSGTDSAWTGWQPHERQEDAFHGHGNRAVAGRPVSRTVEIGAGSWWHSSFASTTVRMCGAKLFVKQSGQVFDELSVSCLSSL